MLGSLRANAKLLVTLLLGALVIVLIVAFDGLGRSSFELTAQAFQSPIQTPTPPLPTATNASAFSHSFHGLSAADTMETV